ncbi:MAG: 50S ribosomal protein L6 [Chloroflexi bacterium]|nr:50S ribosomal protein L6 [Chloroflexota bacterium]
MSKIGRKPITLPKGVEVTIQGQSVNVKGPKGALAHEVHPFINVVREDDVIKAERSSDEPAHRALHGLTRNLIANMVTGVSEGYTRSLDLVGVGYRVQQSGKNVKLSVMLSHEVEFAPPEGVALEVEGQNRIYVRGIDKQLVGNTAARIRKVRPPNAYTGKGIRYLDESIKLKPGKSARRA